MARYLCRAAPPESANWIIIPTLDAAPTAGFTVYLVGGTLSYTQDGTPITIPIAGAPIQVFPQPELVVGIFMTGTCSPTIHSRR